MPAAAVIPAPIAYTKVVAVKKLVVGFLRGRGGAERGGARCGGEVVQTRAACWRVEYIRATIRDTSGIL